MPGGQGDRGDRVERMRRAGLAAAVALAREQGLPADDPRVLSGRRNLLVRLARRPWWPGWRRTRAPAETHWLRSFVGD